ncbi:MAG: tyrosine-type recombinase/integrase [Erysipelatoclostridium sp.]|nr:tyrosine-type recombinase/integrase [Thomasclavelia sp.]
MLLLKFCKRYIVRKYDYHKNAYAPSEKKILFRELLLQVASYNELNETITYLLDNKFYSIGNYKPIVQFCIYAVSLNFPYLDKGFDDEIFADFMCIYSCGKKLSTRSYYIGIVSTFIMEFNINEHKDARTIDMHRFMREYSVYHSMNERLTDDEIRKLLIELKRIKSEKLKMIVLILLKTGIRVSEMLHIRKKDIFKQGDLYLFNIKGKGNMYRMVSIKEIEFRTFYRTHIKSLELDDYVFLSRTKNQITRFYVYKEIKKILRRIGIIKEQNGPHLLRHTFASKMYEKFRDILLLQEYIGHTNVESTKRYIHLHESELKKTTVIYDEILQETISIIVALSIHICSLFQKQMSQLIL